MGYQRRLSRWLIRLSLFRTPDEEVIPAAPRGWLPPLSGPLIGRSSCCARLSRLVTGQTVLLLLRLDGLAVLPPPYTDLEESPACAGDLLVVSARGCRPLADWAVSCDRVREAGRGGLFGAAFPQQPPRRRTPPPRHERRLRLAPPGGRPPASARLAATSSSSSGGSGAPRPAPRQGRMKVTVDFEECLKDSPRFRCRRRGTGPGSCGGTGRRGAAGC